MQRQMEHCPCRRTGWMPCVTALCLLLGLLGGAGQAQDAFSSKPRDPFAPGPLDVNTGEAVRRIVIEQAVNHTGAETGQVVSVRQEAVLDVTLDGRRYRAEALKPFTIMLPENKPAYLTGFRIKTLNAWSLDKGLVVPANTYLTLSKGRYIVEDPKVLAAIDRALALNEALWKEYADRLAEDEKAALGDPDLRKEYDRRMESIEKTVSALEEVVERLRKKQDNLGAREEYHTERYNRIKDRGIGVSTDRLDEYKSGVKAYEGHIEQLEDRLARAGNNLESAEAELDAAKEDKRELEKQNPARILKSRALEFRARYNRLRSARNKHKTILEYGTLLTETDMRKNFEACMRTSEQVR